MTRLDLVAPRSVGSRGKRERPRETSAVLWDVEQHRDWRWVFWCIEGTTSKYVDEGQLDSPLWSHASVNPPPDRSIEWFLESVGIRVPREHSRRSWTHSTQRRVHVPWPYVSGWEECPIVHPASRTSWWSCCKFASTLVHEWNTVYWNEQKWKTLSQSVRGHWLHFCGGTIFIFPFFRLSDTFQKTLDIHFFVVLLSFGFIAIDSGQQFGFFVN